MNCWLKWEPDDPVKCCDVFQRARETLMRVTLQTPSPASGLVARRPG